MPGGDRTGPLGAGPMTGRAAGFCAGFGTPGYANPAPGMGFGGRGRGRGFRGGGWGRGGGRGWRNWYYATGVPGWARGGRGFGPYAPYYGAPPAVSPTAEQEMELLREQAKYFDEALADIRKRMDELSVKQKAE